MQNVLPLFTTDSSLGKSILTSDDPEAIDNKTGKKYFKPINEESTISIWSIAYHHNLDKVFVVEDSMIGFINHYKYSKKINKQLVFGVKFKIVNNSLDNTIESFRTESDIVVFVKNSSGYRDLIKLYTAINADPLRYIWDKYSMKGYNRGDWKLLQEYWTDNLVLVIPFYDSFLHRNTLEYGHHSIPEFGKIKPTFILETHHLPFDELINNAVINYCKESKYNTINGHSIFYYKNEDIRPYQVFRTISLRTTFEMPEMPYFSQPTFSFESWQERINETI